MEFLAYFWDMVVHLDKHLNDLATVMGPWLYLVLFAIVFCETGLVVTPFLPGDSLLFAVGALCALAGSPLNLPLMIAVLLVAAIAGDAVNYAIGSYLGPKVFHYENSRLLNRKHLLRTHEFYERHGGKTIILARFIPIIRTFAPFVAGIGNMTYRRFFAYNVIGALLWVIGFTLAGYALGNHPLVRKNFHIITLGIIVLSVMPLVVEFCMHYFRTHSAAKPAV